MNYNQPFNTKSYNKNPYPNFLYQSSITKNNSSKSSNKNVDPFLIILFILLIIGVLIIVKKLNILNIIKRKIMTQSGDNNEINPK